LVHGTKIFLIDRMKNTPGNQQECMNIVKKIIQDIDPDLVNSSDGEEDLEVFDISFVCDSIRKQHIEEVYTASGIHRPMKQRNQVSKTKDRKLTKGEKTVSFDKTKLLARSVKKSSKETAEKILSKASSGLKENPILEQDGEAIFILRFSNRDYTVDLTTSTPTFTCPRFKQISSCKHIVMTLVLLGTKANEEEKNLLTAKTFNRKQRNLVDQKILSFNEASKSFPRNIENFQTSLLPKSEKEIKNLPEHQQTNIRNFKSYNDCMNYIKDPTNGNTAGHWAVTVADSNRRLCPAMHEGERRICKGSLVLAADYDTVHKTIDGSFTTKRARRYFHARVECFNHIPAEMKRFTNLLPVTSGVVDASTLPDVTKEQIRRVLPSVNFV
jgi:hypothetical protein